MDPRPPDAQPSDYDPRAHGAKCDVCPLNGRIPVPPERPKNPPRFVAIGLHPGRYEERMGVPLVGPSGQIFDRCLGKAAVRRRDGLITNAILCRPDDEDEKNDAAYEACAPRLFREILETPPEVPVLTMGADTVRTLLGVRSVFLARGFVWTAEQQEDRLKTVEAAIRKATKEKDDAGVAYLARRKEVLELRHAMAGRRIFPTLNTAFLLKVDAWRPVVERDISRFARWMRGELTESMLAEQGDYKVVSGVREVRDALAKLGPVVSLDIETDGVKPLEVPILCAGLADADKRTVVIGPWDPHAHPRLLTEALAQRTAVMHNGYNFDQIALEKDGVRFPRRRDGWLRVEDTLTAHHTFASHMFQRLDHVASFFLDCGPWKMTHGSRGGTEEKGLLPAKMTPDDRHLYNAMDAKIQILAWGAMQRSLAREQAIYEHDKQVAEICKEMHVVGIRRDAERVKHLVERMKRRNRELTRNMRRLAGKKSFAPSKTADVRKALFGRLRAPIIQLTPKGLVSTSAGTLEALKRNDTRVGEFARNLLDWRAIAKSRSTYIEKIETMADGRVHPIWKPFGTVSGRFSGRLQSAPRLVFTLAAQRLLARGMKTKEVIAKLGIDRTYELESRIRELYIPEEGWEFNYFDLSQSEMRVAAYISGDDAFIASCESGDVHTANARILFAADPEAVRILDALIADPKNASLKGEAKIYRDITKNAGFGILYKAEAKTILEFLIGKGFEVELKNVIEMFDTLHARYHVYYRFCNGKLEFCLKNGYLRSILLGRLRVFGYHPKPTDIYNYSVQSFVADLMNLRMIEMRKRLPRKDVRIVGQWHDALVFESRKGAPSELTQKVIKETWAKPIFVPSSGRTFVMPIDQKTGTRLSDFC